MMRSFTVLPFEQRSPEWVQARLGRVTSSRANDMLKEKQSAGEAAGRRNLRVALMLERITGRSQDDDYQSPAMLQGMEREADALLLYEGLTGQIVTRTGFLAHDTLMAGCSLDGHVGDFEGIVEVKSPIPATHLDYITTGKVPLDYYRQIQHELWITGARWADFVSFNPDFPAKAQLKVVRVTRNDKEIADHDSKVRAFLAEVDAAVASFATFTDLPGTLAAAGARS